MTAIQGQTDQGVVAATAHEGAPTAQKAATPRPSPYRIVIEPPRRWPSLDLAELWRYRDLLYMLVWRDISARYRQSVAGFGWAIIHPLASMAIFTVVFGKIAQLPTDGIPAPIFYLAALLPWGYFSGCLSRATGSVVGGRSLLTRVYFPRLVLPLSSVLSGLVDFAIQFVVLVGMIGIYRLLGDDIAPSWGILLLPVLLLLCLVTALSVGLWLTALNVKYRDVEQIIPFVGQAWMWLTPVVYPSSMIEGSWRVLYGLNPMVGVIEAFRWAVVSSAQSPDFIMMGVSFAVVGLLFVGGLYFFLRVEQTFVDVI